MVSPVLGFLAVLANLTEGLKTPNPLNSALLPFDNAAVISFIIISSTLSASLTVILFFSENFIIKSDFFNTTPYFFSSLSCLFFSFVTFFSFFTSVSYSKTLPLMLHLKYLLKKLLSQLIHNLS